MRVAVREETSVPLCQKKLRLTLIGSFWKPEELPFKYLNIALLKTSKLQEKRTLYFKKDTEKKGKQVYYSVYIKKT